MSWQAYVDDNLLRTGDVNKAAIFGHDGSCWATSAGFSVSSEEAKELIKSMNDGSVSGKHIAGKKYMMLRNNKERKCGYLKLKEHGGFCVCLTKQALILGGFDDGGNAGMCNNTVENLAQYLVDSGY